MSRDDFDLETWTKCQCDYIKLKMWMATDGGIVQCVTEANIILILSEKQSTCDRQRDGVTQSV